jgi:hypothetical protein
VPGPAGRAWGEGVYNCCRVALRLRRRGQSQIVAIAAMTSNVAAATGAARDGGPRSARVSDGCRVDCPECRPAAMAPVHAGWASPLTSGAPCAALDQTSGRSAFGNSSAAFPPPHAPTGSSGHPSGTPVATGTSLAITGTTTCAIGDAWVAYIACIAVAAPPLFFNPIFFFFFTVVMTLFVYVSSGFYAQP